MGKRIDSYIGVRVPLSLKNRILQSIDIGSYVTQSEFTRSAIKEKILRDILKLRSSFSLDLDYKDIDLYLLRGDKSGINYIEKPIE